MLLVLGVNISRPDLKWVSLTLITLEGLGRVFKRMNLTPRAYSEIVKQKWLCVKLTPPCLLCSLPIPPSSQIEETLKEIKILDRTNSCY
jgi:hypothetical protein